MRILITGASGSGTTTTGRALAECLDCRFVDSDDYFWELTEPPYSQRRDPLSRLLQLQEDMVHGGVVAGSVMGWGANLEGSFDLIVFRYLESTLRLERLKQREVERFGKADPAFLEWAASYDHGTSEGRSLMRHEEWLRCLTTPVLRLEGDISVDECLSQILSHGALSGLK